MKKKSVLMWAVMVGAAVSGLTSCGIDEPKMTNSSYETMTVKKALAAYNERIGKAW